MLCPLKPTPAAIGRLAMRSNNLAATLTWLDHDAADRDRMNRILALFRERDTRDELGIGVIRDLLADELFPGTNTIQTRLRYMLIVPWIYQGLEKKCKDRSTFAAKARELEVAVVKALSASDDTAGVSANVPAAISNAYQVQFIGRVWACGRFDGFEDHKSSIT